MRWASGSSPRGLTSSVTITSGRHCRMRRTRCSSSRWAACSPAAAFQRARIASVDCARPSSARGNRQAVSARLPPAATTASCVRRAAVSSEAAAPGSRSRRPRISTAVKWASLPACEATSSSGRRSGALKIPSSAARVPPLRCTRHVCPPSRVCRIVPRLPTAQPRCASLNHSPRSGTVLSVGNANHVWPLSGEWTTHVPGAPASHTRLPRTASARKSRSRTAAGSAAGAAFHEQPPSLVCKTRPPSPTSQPLAGLLSSSRRRYRGPAGGAGLISLVLTAASAPPVPASAPLVASRKSPVIQPSDSPLGTGDQLRPPSAVRKTPEGNRGELSPIAQPWRESIILRCARPGSASPGVSCQVRPPSRVRRTTPCVRCV